jgi:hypothetical protein
MEHIHQLTPYYDILYTDRPSKHERLLISPFLREPKNTKQEGGWKLKIIFCFVETTREPLQLRQVKFGTLDLCESLSYLTKF